MNYWDRPKKEDVRIHVEKLLQVRQEYKDAYSTLIANQDYSDQYKQRKQSELITFHKDNIKGHVSRATSVLNTAITEIEKVRGQASVKRNAQLYTVQLQNALQTMELTGNELTDVEITEVIAPFKLDAIAMKTLGKMATKSGMDSFRVAALISYEEHPTLGMLQNLKNLLASYVNVDFDNFDDAFANEIAIESTLDKLPSDLIAT